MIEDWIDAIAKAWGGMIDPKGRNVRSYYAFTKAEFPESITEFPSCLTYPESVRGNIGGDSGPQILFWRGKTEFHLCPDANKAQLPYVMRMFGKIISAAVGVRTLGGLVNHFGLLTMEAGNLIDGPVVLRYGEENGHWGLIANWSVKEEVGDELTLGL